MKTALFIYPIGFPNKIISQYYLNISYLFFRRQWYPVILKLHPLYINLHNNLLMPSYLQYNHNLMPSFVWSNFGFIKRIGNKSVEGLLEKKTRKKVFSIFKIMAIMKMAKNRPHVDIKMTIKH